MVHAFLRCVSVLAGDTITEVIESMERTSPRDPKWQTEVVVGVKKLVNTTLPDLSNKVPVTLNPSIPLHAQTTPWFVRAPS